MYILYEPTGFCFKTELRKLKWTETTIQNHLWKYHYVFTVLVENYYMKNYTGKYAPIRYAQLDRILKNSKIQHKRTRLSTLIMDDLVRWKVIILERKYGSEFTTPNGFTVTNYVTDVRFKFYDEFITNGFTEWNDTTVKQAPKGWQVNTPYLPEIKPLTGVYAQLGKMLPQVKIDAVAARNFAATAKANRMPLRDKKRGHVLITGRVVDEVVYSCWKGSINAIERGDYSPAQDEFKTGRFFSRLTSLPKVLRPFLSINGQPLVEVDVSNCQCTIFAMYLKEWYAVNGLELPRDVVKFIRECEAGTFYATAQALIDPNYTVNPKEFKISFFAKVFFSSGTRNYEWVKGFKHSYSNVYKAINDYKQAQGYKLLPTHLQSLESDVMLNGVVKQLIHDGLTTFYTIHDAIYCTADIRGKVEATITAEFKKYGVTPHIKSK